MIYVGISGWRYAPWRGVFYPEDLPQNRELDYASRRLTSIEVNGTFYGTQKSQSFERWYNATPENFVFSLKGPRYITHIKRLKNIDEPMARFFDSGVLLLREKLGPILWQLPPNFKCDLDRLEPFFKCLPKQHRHALEVRNYSFENPEFIELLNAYNIALVFADTAGKWPYMEDVTGDFIYIRLHGEKELYKSGYGESSLQFWAERISAWHNGGAPVDALAIHPGGGRALTASRKKARDVYAYFDNDVKVHAPFDAIRLADILKLKSSLKIDNEISDIGIDGKETRRLFRRTGESEAVADRD